MRRTVLMVLILLLTAILVGCGGERDVDIQIHIEGQGTEDAAAQPTATPVAAAPTRPAEQPTALPTEAAAPAEPTVAPPPTEAPTTAPPPTAEAAPTQPPPPPPPTQAAEVLEEFYTFDPGAWEQSVTTLSSFRQRVTLDFVGDTAGVHSKVTYEGEVTTNPTALHSILRVEGQAASQLPSNQVEVILIGNKAWVKVGRRPWVPVPASQLEAEYGGQVVGVGELLPYVQQAQRVMPDETVNGIPCKHYVYNVSNMQAEAAMTDAQGDIWAAKDGGYVVRLTMNGHGTYYGAYTSSGTLNLVYDLYDVNAPITISPPH